MGSWRCPSADSGGFVLLRFWKRASSGGRSSSAARRSIGRWAARGRRRYSGEERKRRWRCSRLHRDSYALAVALHVFGCTPQAGADPACALVTCIPRLPPVCAPTLAARPSTVRRLPVPVPPACAPPHALPLHASAHAQTPQVPRRRLVVVVAGTASLCG